MTKFAPYRTRNRFYVEFDDNWCLIDSLDGSLVGFKTKKEAEEAATWTREYVKRQGDIDLQSFPYDLDEPPNYDTNSRAELLEQRPWLLGTKWEAKWKEDNREFLE